MQVSRSGHLKIPKKIEEIEKNSNSKEDILEVQKAIAMANDKKLKAEGIQSQEEIEDKEWQEISKIPENSNDLIAITVVKKLGAYVIAITEKSPKKFRGVFVNRMQNYCLDTLECLLEANFIRLDSIENKKKREEYQKEAIIKLKLLGYIALVAENAACILKRQYKQISLQLAKAINLIIAWKKSDDERWKTKN